MDQRPPDNSFAEIEMLDERPKELQGPEYAATIPLRNQSANSSLSLVDGYQPAATRP